MIFPAARPQSAQYLSHHLALVARTDALIAAAADGKALVDDACARKAVAAAVSE